MQQQRPESLTVTLTWHACEYKVDKYVQGAQATQGSVPVLV